MSKVALALLILVVVVAPSRAGIEDLTYPSKLLGQDVPIKVYTPPGYDTGRDRYPVVYNLHGGGGSPQRQWDRIRKTLTDAMDNQRAAPVIYVFVNGLGNSEFVNTADGKPIERSIITELIPFIDSKYRTIASREARAIDGFSMGGFGCLSVAFRNPDTFCAVCSYGAALTISATGRNYKSPEHFTEHNPADVVKANTDAIRKGVRVRMVCGDADYLYESNVRLKDLLESLNIPVDWVSVPGVAHNTMGLYEEVGLESLGFLHESFELAAKGGR
jgi:endo-1,4-beta-xylanase